MVEALAVQESIDWTSYLVRITHDAVPPDVVDIYCLAAGGTESYPGSFEAMRRAWAAKEDVHIYLLDLKAGVSGYQGFEFLRDMLVMDYGIPSDVVRRVPHEDVEMANTLTEAQALIRLLEEDPRMQGRPLALCAPAFHLPRSFLSMVSSMGADWADRGLQIYCIPGVPMPWHQIVTHSQGELVGQRKDMIPAELLRVVKYTQKGDLVPISQALAYLDHRDRTHPPQCVTSRIATKFLCEAERGVQEGLSPPDARQRALSVVDDVEAVPVISNNTTVSQSSRTLGDNQDSS